MKEYLITLKDSKYHYYFKTFLKCHHIPYEYLNDTEIYIVKITQNCAMCIKQLYYIDDISEDKLIPVNPDPKPIPIDLDEPSDYPSNDLPGPNWGVYKIQAPNLWNKGFLGQGINVAVLDSGVSNHRQLNIKEKLSFLDDDPSPEDFFGHGTVLCGIIGAQPQLGPIIGVSYSCNLYSLKVLNSFGKIEIEALVRALEWCIDNNIHVINMSFGFENIPEYISQYEILLEAIQKVREKGIVLVAGTGNSNEIGILVPSIFNEVIAVGATNINDIRWDDVNEGSNYGAGLDFMAPGVNIASTSNNDAYVYATGTSFACPHVAGLIALLLSQDPTLTQEQLVSILISNATKLPIGNPDVFEYGYGLVKAPF